VEDADISSKGWSDGNTQNMVERKKNCFQSTLDGGDFDSGVEMQQVHFSASNTPVVGNVGSYV
jgi:hypothetical protein